ncbi:MAG: DNA-deoxyinosine glycosylase [Candidatus Moranbacteria bacterium]|nr:DNA-deoxyinosine glycosylase [Candidatus Moranbacteria bacterium]
MKKGLKPIVDQNSRILILGSMPGEESLKKKEYYGFKHNHFWEILFRLFHEKTREDYEEKKIFVLNHNIAIWDVIKNCEREGSLDSNIKNPQVNDFDAFFKDYPNIERIYFNGKAAENLFKKFVLKQIAPMNKQFISLPSTSPANTIGIEKKILQWAQLVSKEIK